MPNLKKTLLAALALTVFTAACADGPSAPRSVDVEPDPALRAFFETTGGIADSLEPWSWLNPIPEDVTVSKLCGKSGCTLRSADGALQLTIPKKALSRRTTISMTQIAGSVVAVELGPHGTTFDVPVRLYVNATHTTAGSLPVFDGCGQVMGAVAVNEWIGVYWEGDPNQGVQIIETFPAYQASCWVFFDTDHFSGYAIAM